MTIFTLLAVLLVAVLAYDQVHAYLAPQYSGQPGCKTDEELTVGVYRHFRNKRAFLRCRELGVAATLELCPYNQGFLESARACVPWSQWTWTPTVAPPSLP